MASDGDHTVIMFPTTVLHWLKGSVPDQGDLPDGYEESTLMFEDVAAVAAHLNFSKSTRVVGSGTVQWETTVKFQCDVPPVSFDFHYRIQDEADGALYDIVDYDVSSLFGCVDGTLRRVQGMP